MAKKKVKLMVSEQAEAELNMEPEKKEKLNDYRKNVERRLKELEYEQSNGYMPPKPWYEE